MYEATLYHYQLQLSLVGNQDNQKEHKMFMLEKFNYIHILSSYAYYRSHWKRYVLPRLHQPYKTESDRYAYIPLQVMLRDIIQDYENLLRCHMNQLIGMEVTQSKNISSARSQNESCSSSIFVLSLVLVAVPR